MRTLLERFLSAEKGGAVMTYMVFTGCWAALIAIGLHVATPKMTTKLSAASTALRAGPNR